MGKDGDEKRSRMWILISLFLVRGPFALRLLWKNDEFRPSEKIVLTAAVAVYTVILVVALIYTAKRIHTSLAF